MLLVLFLSACGGSDNGKAGTTIDSSVDDADTEAGEERHETTRKIFERVPSPVESASLLRKAGASYDMTILNPIENVSGYETIKAKALNLGIYSTDLSYASMFEQTQEIMVYSSCAKKLSDGLGITEAYDEKTLERIENNLADKDSILDIIGDAFWLTEAHLKENKRANLSALIIAGGWIEGLYVSTRLIQDNNTNPGLVLRVAEQKYSLNNLIRLIDQYEEDHKLVGVRKDLQQLAELFEKVEVVQKGEQAVSTSEQSNVTTIDSGKEMQVEAEALAAIVEATAEIRNKYISGE